MCTMERGLEAANKSVYTTGNGIELDTCGVQRSGEKKNEVLTTESGAQAEVCTVQRGICALKGIFVHYEKKTEPANECVCVRGNDRIQLARGCAYSLGEQLNYGKK